MKIQETNNLWSSWKTGWILYPSVIVFIAATIWSGMAIRIDSQSLWSALIQELTK